MTNIHVCNWEILRGPKFVMCKGCDTVSDIDDLLANTKEASAHAERLKVLSDQLFSKDLKKDAFDKAYAYVLQFRDIDVSGTAQLALKVNNLSEGGAQ